MLADQVQLKLTTAYCNNIVLSRLRPYTAANGMLMFLGFWVRSIDMVHCFSFQYAAATTISWIFTKLALALLIL